MRSDFVQDLQRLGTGQTGARLQIPHHPHPLSLYRRLVVRYQPCALPARTITGGRADETNHRRRWKVQALFSCRNAAHPKLTRSLSMPLRKGSGSSSGSGSYDSPPESSWANRVNSATSASSGLSRIQSRSPGSDSNAACRTGDRAHVSSSP